MKNIAIHIYPKAGEDWNISTPIENTAIPHHIIFPVGREDATATQGTVIFGRLLDISSIDRGVSILENRGIEDKEFKGVGGISKTSDFDITLCNFDGCIDIFKLLGRTLKICVLEASDPNLNYSDDDCLFSGYIKEVVPSQFNIILTIADPVLKELSKTIGTELDTDKIIPINYGDFTVDPNAKMAAVYKGNKVYVDSMQLEAIENIQIYDSSLKEFYSNDGELTLNTDKNEVSLITPTTLLVSVFELFADTRFVIMYNPYSRAYLPSADASTVAAGAQYSYTVGAVTVRLYCMLLKNGYLIFDDPYSHLNTLPQPPATGTLTKVAGSGPTTLAYSFRSEPINPVLYYEADIYDTSDTDKESMINKANRCLFKIDDEVCQVARQGTHFLNSYNGYQYTAYYVMRGVNNTTPAGHAMFTACDIVKDEESSISSNDVLTDLYSKKYTFGHTFKVQGSSGMTCILEDLTDGYGGTLVPTNSTDLVATHGNLNKIGETDPVSVNISTASPINGGSIYDLYFEIKLPKPNLSADIIDMFFCGKVEFDLSEQTDLLYDGDYSHLALLLSKGGLKIPIVTLGSDNCVGHFNEEPELIYIASGDSIGFFRIASNYPCLTGSRLNASSQWYGDPLNVNSYTFEYNTIAQESIDRESFTPGTVVRQWFDNTVAGRNPLKCFSLSANPGKTLSGLVSNLTDLELTKYFLIIKSSNHFKLTEDPYVSLNQSILLSNIGLHVIFAVDLNNQDIWVSGKGRVTSPSSQPINYPNTILQHLLLNEYSFAQVTAYDYSYTLPGLKTTLSISGPRKKLFDSLEDFCKKHCLVISYNRIGQLIIQSCLPEMQGHTDFEITLTNSDLLPDDWSQSYTSVDGLIKTLTLKYAQNKINDSYTKSCNSAAYTSAYGASNETVLEHPFIYEQASAEWLVEKLLDFYRKPIRTLKVKAQIGYYQIGAWVKINSNFFPKTAGNNYLLVNTSDKLPVNDSPYTELTLLEINTVITPDPEESTNIFADITETSNQGDINETSSDSTITES